MAWSPAFANAELARMRESSGPKPSIRSKSFNDEDYFGGSKQSKKKSRTDRIKEIERKIRLGLDFDADEADELGVYIPRDYERQGRAYVRKKIVRPESAGFTPTTYFDGGSIYGSGPKGSLTGEDVRGILGERESQRAAGQEAFLQGAIGKIKSRQAEQAGYKAMEQQSILDEMIAMEKDRKAKLSGTTSVGMGRTERQYKKWAEKNPEKAKDLELRGRSITLEEQKFIEAKAKTKKQSEAISAMDAFIQENKDDPEFKGIIGELNTFRGAILAGTPIDSVSTMIENKLKSAEEKAAKKQEDQLAKEARAEETQIRRENRAATELDRRLLADRDETIAE